MRCARNYAFLDLQQGLHPAPVVSRFLYRLTPATVCRTQFFEAIWGIFYWYFYAYAYAAKQVYFLRCRANSRRCLRRCLAFGYVARCCSRRNARLSCGADNGGRNTFPHTISPFTPFFSVLLRSGAFRFLKPNCVAWLLSNNR